ncbi:phage terminase small subunit P27 family [Mycolicibacter hiberniae]|uniref:Uncharacterized protein n=1 Tax=Mycolicibacter hiberniae TaxID=29314 RepID=A0A7I7X1V3_9MYCO|nr:phage terminase small subunit P27 family [Mycolicibacter hiberniae]MCV7085808.1 phage terminase small subunit P27 family [Mycolicibacter hiberniae]ORV73224.1 hypothetical protein AWC09_00040 [Mycolicibacter hiberniae]BBZ22827.1 hypothetical protein MHIB_12450 [Mycolicibacter hiberniae]
MPAPLPPKIRLLHGRGNGKDSAGYVVPTPPSFERVAPEPPDWLDDEGRDEWQRVIDDLAPLNLLKNSDRAVLVAHCEAWSRLVAAVKHYHADGLTKTNPDSGRVAKHPSVTTATEAAAQLMKTANQLGLTPVSERGLGTITVRDDDDDPFAAS